MIVMISLCMMLVEYPHCTFLLISSPECFRIFVLETAKQEKLITWRVHEVLNQINFTCTTLHYSFLTFQNLNHLLVTLKKRKTTPADVSFSQCTLSFSKPEPAQSILYISAASVHIQII